MRLTHSEPFNNASYFLNYCYYYYYYHVDWKLAKLGWRGCVQVCISNVDSPYGPEFCSWTLWWISSFLVWPGPPYVWDLCALPASQAHPHLIQRAHWDLMCLDKPGSQFSSTQILLMISVSADHLHSEVRRYFPMWSSRSLIICTFRPSVNLKLIFECAVW